MAQGILGESMYIRSILRYIRRTYILTYYVSTYLIVNTDFCINIDNQIIDTYTLYFNLGGKFPAGSTILIDSVEGDDMLTISSVLEPKDLPDMHNLIIQPSVLDVIDTSVDDENVMQ